MADCPEKLMEQARKTSAYFSSLIELIPSKHYLPEDETIEDSDEDISGLNGKAAREAKKVLAKKAKLLKLDPGKHKTIAEIQKEIDQKQNKLNAPPNVKSAGGIKPIKVSEVPSVPLEDLRKKLQDRIQQLRGKRKFKEEKVEEKAKKRKVEKSSRKDKLKKEGKNSGILKSNVENEKKITQVLNDKGEVVFSKFDFAEGSSKKKKPKSNDIKTLLKKAEKRKTNLEKVEEESKEKADELKSKMIWDKALKHAEGVKVKDDPKLLAKTLKRKQKIKKVSKNKWEERVNMQKKLQDDKQKLRKKHIQERKEKKGTKGGKSKKPAKKGKKHKPGF